MTTWFSLLSIVVGILVGAAIWSMILKIKRFEQISRLVAIVGAIVLIGMFIYSLSVIKGAAYSRLIITFLSLLYSAMYVVLGILTVGIMIILAVGGYWCVVNFRNTDFKVLWSRMRHDFLYGWERIKAWIEGEE